MIVKIEALFDHEVILEDSWEIPSEGYASLSLEDKKQAWFSINPEKLNKKTRMKQESFIVSEREKGLLLHAFQVLKNYTEDMPSDAHFKERLLASKSKFPPVFFSDTD